LGSISINVTNATNAYYNFYADYDVDYPTEGSFLDEGSANGTQPGNVSYSINDPNLFNGVTSPSGFTLFDQFANNNLDNTNDLAGQPQNNPPNVCCDVGFGLGIGGLNGSGTVTFTISTSLPASGFYLEQDNLVTGTMLYASVTSTVAPTGSTSGTPEPSTFGLGILGLVGGVAAWKRRRAA